MVTLDDLPHLLVETEFRDHLEIQEVEDRQDRQDLGDRQEHREQMVVRYQRPGTRQM
jgi:hypothetical protein